MDEFDLLYLAPAGNGTGPDCRPHNIRDTRLFYLQWLPFFGPSCLQYFSLFNIVYVQVQGSM